MTLSCLNSQGHHVLDVGCGIGGPLREIARFSGTLITGVNNNGYQISRGEEFNRMAGVDKTCNYVKVGKSNSWESHSVSARDCYKEIYRVLKPGQCFAAYEWCITESFDPLNQEHYRIKGEVELGNGLPDIRSMDECLEALQLAGFEVIWEKDVAVASSIPWYLPLDKNQFSLSSFQVTAVGRFITRNMAQEFWSKPLEFLHLAPDGSQRVQTFLEKAADALVEDGREILS
ncbi:hypothetical protein SADUNF_Sadunf16G0049900 [Salix dunnii]|uniref:SAM-dependent methyltransferase Erg6/SMT-type domain-containing protein n=1 Tax=Salix dunnii TaxID=1413687 RepID=A0A835MIA5_9ROSI|nr:hypothetical protein SADUNF_Sadunf16G0049900 [Salix dunnii]